METKRVSSINRLHFTEDFPGLRGVNIMGNQYAIEPFLVFTEYEMKTPVFGPHPHAGVSVMTYMLPDSRNSFINRDSLGDHSIIEPGGLHITQAGRGMFHDEFPQTTGMVAHGFQIWINHSTENRFVNPRSFHASAHEIPEVITNAYAVRVLHGAFNGQRALHTMVTPVTLLHVLLQPQATIQLRADEMAFVYGLRGGGVIDGHNFGAQTLVTFEASGHQLIVEARDEPVNFMVASGTPLNEPIVYGGPFVMSTAEQMSITRKRLGRGELGTLAPYSSTVS